MSFLATYSGLNNFRARTEIPLLIVQMASETPRYGLVFIQARFSGDLSAVKTVISNLIKDRGILFELPGGTNRANQIAQLNDKEEDVTVVFSCRREAKIYNNDGTVSVPWQNLVKSTADKIKGRILVSLDRKAGADFFGPTFSVLSCFD
jgi:hypothetical protein